MPNCPSLIKITFYTFPGMTVPGSKSKAVFQSLDFNTTQIPKQATDHHHPGPDFHSRINRNAGSSEAEQKKFTGLYTGPYFDPNLLTNISAQLGDSALLMCNVNQIGSKTVNHRKYE